MNDAKLSLQSQSLMRLLNRNRVEDVQVRETIISMGMSSCQTGCLCATQGPTHYCSAH